MRERRGGIEALSVLLFGLLPIAVLFTAYVVLYVQSRNEYLTQRNFRALATMGRNLASRLEATNEVLRNQRVDGQALAANRDWVKEIPNLSAERCLVEGKEPALEWKLVDTRTSSRLSLGCRTVQIDRILKPSLAPSLFDDLLVVQADTSKVVYHWHAFDTGALPDLAKLLKDTPADGDDASKSDETKKKDAAGKGKETDGSGGNGDDRDSKESGAGQGFNFAQPGHLDYFGERYLAYFVPLALDFKFGAGEGAAGANGADADGRKKEKAANDGRSGADGERLVLCGLVRQGRFMAEARELSLSLLLTLVMILLFAFLMFPLLKLWFLGARERLDALNVHILVLALVIALGLLTVGLLDFLLYRGLVARFDAELASLAVEMEARLGKEMLSAYRTLHEGAEAWKEWRDVSAEVDVYDEGIEQLLWVEASGKPRAIWKATEGTNGDGAQSDAAGPHKLKSADVPPQLNVADRGYFQDVRAAKFWRLDSARFAAEVVQSRLDGGITMVLAVPVDGKNRDEMALVSHRPASVLGPKLPPGFSFAIIDRYGKVMLHSDERRILQENLFQETDDGGRLKSAVAARREQHADGFYYGKEYRFYVRPMKGSPWSLVVLRQKEQLRRINVAAVVAWGLMFLIYIIGFVLVALLCRLLWPGYRAEWFWPRRELTRSYCVATFLCLLTLACCFVIPEPEGARGQLVRLVAAPLMAFLAVYVVLARRSTLPWITALASLWICGAMIASHATVHAASATAAPLLVALAATTLVAYCEPTPAANERVFRAAYTLMLIALLVVMGAAPSAVLFDDASDQAMVSFLRWTQRESLRAKAALAGKAAGGRAAEGIYEDLFRHAATAAPVASNGASGPIGPRLTRWLEQRPLEPRLAAVVFPRIPLRSDDLAGIDHMVEETATDGSWKWSGSRNGERGGTMEISEVGFAAGDEIPSVVGKVPSFFSDAGSGAWTVAALVVAGLAVAAFFVLRSTARRLFLLDADVNGIVHVPVCTPGSTGLGMLWRPFRRLVAGGDGDELMAWARANGVVCDLAVETPGACGRRIDRLHAESNGIVIIDHFEAGFDDPKSERGKLDLLDRLDKREELAVVILSDLDPLSFAAAVAEEAADEKSGGQGKGGASVRRWADALRGYDCSVIFPAESSPGGDGGVLGPDLAGVLGRRLGEQREEGRSVGRHWRLWNRLTKREKLALTQLAEEGFLNPKVSEVARSLMQRGLIRRDPAFRISDGGFPAFVAGVESHATIREWETEGVRSSWAKLRPALVLLLIFGVGFLYATQRGLFSETVAFATAVTGAIPLLLRLFGSLGRQPESASGGR
jgi:hypothetical protein